MKKYIIIVLLLFIPMALQAEELVFVCELYPPYEYMDKGQLQGFEIYVIKEVCKRMQVDPAFRVYPWNRALYMVKTGHADAIFSLFKNSERLEFLYYPAQNISYEHNIIIARKEWTRNISKISDLNGLSVGVIAGYSYGKEFDEYNDMNKEACQNPENLLEKLKGKRMDVAVINDFVFRDLRRKLGYGVDFKILCTISTEPLYVAFSKAKGPHLKELSRSFGDALHEIKNDGTYRDILKKYGDSLLNTQYW